MKNNGLTVALLLTELSLTGVTFGIGLVLLAGTVAITQVTKVDDENLTQFIKLWGTTALFLIMVGLHLLVTLVLLYSFVKVGFRHPVNLEKSERGESLERPSQAFSQLKKRCTIWLMVSVLHLAFVGSQLFWPIPLYQCVYYGLLVGFKLLVIAVVANVRKQADKLNDIALNGHIQPMKPYKTLASHKKEGDEISVPFTTRNNTKGNNVVNFQVKK